MIYTGLADAVTALSATIDAPIARIVVFERGQGATDEVAEDTSYEGLTEIEEAMVDASMQTSLADTPLAVPSGSTTVEVTPGTEAQYQSYAPGTEAQTDGVTV
uniref:Polyprotein protein n=1 Tax=Solanum tuberosum TaxID=4113 RepID=M1DLR0_SOLTU